jgi:predicted NBD/HSP70 family sugar kinase
MSTKRNVNITDRLTGWARTEAQMAEIEQLNQRALQGDPEAQATLERLIQELNAPNNSGSDESSDESSAS